MRERRPSLREINFAWERVKGYFETPLAVRRVDLNTRRGRIEAMLRDRDGDVGPTPPPENKKETIPE